MATSSASLSATSITGLGLSGLSSGLDTSSIITKLMSIEALPQAALKSKLTDTTTYRTALQSLNTAVAALQTSAAAAAQSNALTSFTASTSSDASTASASSSAIASSLTFSVDAVATMQVSYTAPLSDSASVVIPALTIRTNPSGSSPVDTKVTLTSNNLDDVVDAVNKANAGVSATKVLTGGTGSDGKPQYRIQFQSTQTGTANAFDVSYSSSYDSSRAALQSTTAASDAQITIPGSPPIVRASNTITGVMTGVDVTLSAVAASVTVTVKADATAATTAAQTLTASLITLFAGIASSSAVTTSSSSTGSATSTAGSVFTGDSLVRGLKDSLLTAVADPFKNSKVSPSSIGINITKDGTIAFDQSAFAAAMTKDAKGTTAIFQAIAQNVADASKKVSDPLSGTLTKTIANQQADESDLTKQISAWDDRLAVIQAQYTAQFNALETALNSLSSQASYLTSQISGLTTNYQSTK